MALLQDSTYGLLQEAERRSGESVLVRTDPQLSVMARLHYSPARGIPHEIFLSARGAPYADYLVAYQCGFVLRMLDTPPESRRQFQGTQRAAKAVEEMLTGESFAELPRPQFAAIRDQLCGGLLTQLRSTPVGMRIDRWIHDSFPSLREQQRSSILGQLSENAQALSPQVTRQFPTGIVNRSGTMNIAFAAFWSALGGESAFVRPYLKHPNLTFANSLLASLNSVDAAPGADCKLVDDWARKLDMADWYVWVPFRLGGE